MRRKDFISGGSCEVSRYKRLRNGVSLHALVRRIVSCCFWSVWVVGCKDIGSGPKINTAIQGHLFCIDFNAPAGHWLARHAINLLRYGVNYRIHIYRYWSTRIDSIMNITNNGIDYILTVLGQRTALFKYADRRAFFHWITARRFCILILWGHKHYLAFDRFTSSMMTHGPRAECS